MLTLPGAARADFYGRLVLGPRGCEDEGLCTIERAFGFVDREGSGWVANPGDETNGADIPRFLRRFAGVPWAPAYMPAVVLHDQYSLSCRPVYGWLATQRMFRAALIESGVSVAKANLLFVGVLIGSGRWNNPVPGQPCPFPVPSKQCIQIVAPDVAVTSWDPKDCSVPECGGLGRF